MKLFDSFNRKIDYLRLSVTDRCNLRCTYCMPSEGVDKLRHDDILSYEEMFRIAEAAVELGVEKIRITGGEPLVRTGLIDFIRSLNNLRGMKDLAITTNGVLLDEMATDLRDAGVKRVNISLDSLNPVTFNEITRTNNLEKVLRGIESAEKAGLLIKLNMVVMRGINDHEILDFAALSMEKPLSVRFIEYMPATSQSTHHRLELEGHKILERIAEVHSLVPVISSKNSGPAKEYRINGAKGSIGLITPMSNHFCSSCNRIRVTSTGMLRGCLFSAKEVDLKPCLRGTSSIPLREAFSLCVGHKEERHHVSWNNQQADDLKMSQIGG